MWFKCVSTWFTYELHLDRKYVRIKIFADPDLPVKLTSELLAPCYPPDAIVTVFEQFVNLQRLATLSSLAPAFEITRMDGR